MAVVRIAGVNLPTNKRTEIALTYIYGIGLSVSKKILAELKIDGNVRMNDLSDDQVNALRTRIEKKSVVEGDLRREVVANIKRLKEIKCHRGGRHSKGLPVRGQRTKTNNRTVRGNTRKTMGSGRKDAGQKT